MGYDTRATEKGAYAIGFSAQATAETAYAIGGAAKAFASNSMAIGRKAETKAQDATSTYSYSGTGGAVGASGYNTETSTIHSGCLLYTSPSPRDS